VTPFSQLTNITMNVQFDEDENAQVADVLMSATNDVTLLAWEHKRITDSA
jgi:hypothetical protein